MTFAILDHLWQSTLCVGAAALVTLLLRRNGAHTRYWLWFAASVKFLVPFTLLVSLGNHFAPRATVSTLTAGTALLPIAFAAQQVAIPFSGAGATAGIAARSGPDLSEIAIALWLLGVLVVSASWFVRWRRLRVLMRTGRPFPICAPVPVLAVPSPVEPGLVGIRRPVLLLPEGLAGHLSSEETRSILAHELCHLRRRDNLTFAIHMLGQTVFWFYPLLWWLGKRLVSERERACDEAVLACGHEAHVYAESILKVCRFYAQASPVCTSGVSGADLKNRVEAIMNGHIDRRMPPAKWALLLAVGAAALVVPIVLGLLTARPAGAQAPAQSASDSAATIAQRRYEQSRPQTEVPFDPKNFDKYVGYYQLTPTAIFHVFRNGQHYFAQLTGQAPVENFPESATEFFATVVAAQISFVTDARGQVTGLILHQNGLLRPAHRMSEPAGKTLEAALQQRISNNKPSPGTEAAVRRWIEAMENGQPNYRDMSPALARAAREQWPKTKLVVQRLGAFKSLAFERVRPNGWDAYVGTFTRGRAEFDIAPLSAEGKANAQAWGVLP